MTTFDPNGPLDMQKLKAMAEAHPALAMEEFTEAIENWKKAGATVFLGAWDEAFRHYEGAGLDDVSHHLAAIQLAFSMCGLAVANYIAAPQIRDVDENGFDPDGDEYAYKAVPELVKRGLAFNIPVLLRYPDRHLEEGNEVRYTETAVKMLEADLKASVLPEDQWRQH